MSYIIDENADNVSNAMVFAYVQHCLTSMLANLPAGMSETQALKTAIEQISARLAFAQSPEIAAHHLGGTRRLLCRGDLLQM